MQTMAAARALIVACLLFMITSSIPLAGKSGMQEAEATPFLKYSLTEELNGMIFYVTEGDTLEIPIIHLGDLTYDELPPGALILPPSFPNLLPTFNWTPEGIFESDAELTSVSPDNPPSAPYGVTLYATQFGETIQADIMIIVKSSTVAQPEPVIKLDKHTYTRDQLIRAKIEDPNSLCNFITNDISNNIVSLTAVRENVGGGSPTADIGEWNIARDGDGSGDMEAIIELGDPSLWADIGNMHVQGNIDFMMSYDRLDCQTNLPEDGNAVITIPMRSAGISFDKSQYAPSDTAVVGVSGTPLTSAPPVVSIYDDMGNLIPSSLSVNPGSANSYSVVMPPLEGTHIVRASYTYEVNDSVGTPRSYTAVAEAKLLQKSLTIEQSSGLHSDDGLMLTLIDPALNTDPNTAENLDLNYAATASGVTVSSGSIPGFLKEVGSDSAIFSNDVYLYFIRTGDEAPPGESILIDGTQDTALTINVGTSPMSLVVEPFEERGDPQGAGSSGVSLPPAQPYGGTEPVVLLTCASHGGDSDGDGLCTNWEYPATGGPLKIPYDGVTYTIANSCSAPAAAGCPDSRHKDIYLEVDYYSPQVSSSAITTALESIRTVFNTAPVSNAYGGNGIKFHYYVNENSAFSTVDVWGTTGNTGNDYDIIKDNKFGTSTERGGSDPSDHTRAKAQGVHYGVFSEYQSPDSGASGNAEYIGNDIIVSLRPFDSTGLIDVVDQIRGTLMHELGHNLGLYHGGPSTVTGYNVNCKTNYPSVMTYIRQLTTAYGTQRYSDDVNEPNPLNSAAPVEQSPSSSVLNIGTGSAMSSLTIVWSLDEGATLPTASIGKTPGTIDWNSDADPPWENPNSFDPPDILDLGMIGCTAATNAHAANIYGADDWDAIASNMNFRELNPTAAGSGFAAGFLPSAEFNVTHYMALKVAGIKSANYWIQSIPYVDFKPPYNTPSVAAEIKLEIGCRLEIETPSCPDNYVPNNVATKSVIDLIKENQIELAVKKLEEVRSIMDDEFGGDPKNDLFSSTTSYTPKDPPAGPIILPMLDNNIASLKVAELNIPFAEAFSHPGVEQTFDIITHDGVCEDQVANKTMSYDQACIIKLTSETVANATGTFSFDRNNLRLDLIGEGPFMLEIHETVAKKVNDVVATDTGRSIPFTQNFERGTGILTIDTNAAYYQREVIIEHDKPKVRASLSTDQCGGGHHGLFPLEHHTSELYVTATSNNPVNTTSSIWLEIRDRQNKTVFLDSAELFLGPKATGCATMNWPSPSVESQDYDAIISVFDEDAGEYVEVSKSKLFIYPTRESTHSGSSSQTSP